MMHLRLDKKVSYTTDYGEMTEAHYDRTTSEMRGLSPNIISEDS
jgi:hypothetical protein